MLNAHVEHAKETAGKPIALLTVIPRPSLSLKDTDDGEYFFIALVDVIKRSSLIP